MAPGVIWEENGNMCACKKKRCNHHSESPKKSGAPARKPLRASESEESVTEGERGFKVAVPVAGGILCARLASWEQFAVLNVADGEIQGMELLSPPFHEIEVLPRWLDNLQVGLIIAGFMTQRALDLFSGRSIDVITGAPSLPPEDLVLRYISGTLSTRDISRDDPARDF